MIERVVLFVSDRLAETPARGGRIHPLVGGLTLAERLAHQVARVSNAAHVMLIGAGSVPEVLSGTPGLEVTLEPMVGDDLLLALEALGASGVLLARSDRLFDNELVSTALSSAPGDGRVSSLAGLRDAKPGVAASECGLVAMRADTCARLLRTLGGAGDPIGLFEELVEAADKSAGVERKVRASERFWCRVEEPADVRVATRTLFGSLGKPVDGFISRSFNRPISTFVSRLIANRPWTPNQISIVVFLIGLASAALMATGRYPLIVASAILFHLASVLDGVDGEISRVKFQATKFGALLDSIFDHIIMVAWMLAAGYAIHYVRGGDFLFMGLAYAILGLAAVGTGLVNYRQITTTRSGQPMELGWDFEKPENARRPLGRLINSIRFFVSRDVDCVILSLLAIFDQLEAILWSTAVVTAVYFVVVIGHQARRALARPPLVGEPKIGDKEINGV